MIGRLITRHAAINRKLARARRLLVAVLAVTIPVASGVCGTVMEPLRPVCVGKLQLSLPGAQRASWSQSFDYSHVERRTGARTLKEFWTIVESRENELRALPHDTESGRLSRSERIGNSAAILLFREHASSRRAHQMQRYLWANGQGYYVFQSAGAMRPELTNDLRPFTEMFTRINVRSEAPSPSTDGFCIDGATVVGNEGKITAGVSVELRGQHPVRLWAGATEDPSGRTPASTADQEPKRLLKARDAVLADEPSAAGIGAAQ